MPGCSARSARSTIRPRVASWSPSWPTICWRRSGSVIVPQGLRAGRSAGRLTVRGASGETELDLVPGGLQLVDLPPGAVATVDLRFRDPVGLGTRGRRLSVEVGGGLGGLLVDLRDVPLRLPERTERRRAMLDAWEAAFWAGRGG